MPYDVRRAPKARASGGFSRNGEGPSPQLSRNEELVYIALREAAAPMKAYALLERLSEDGMRAPMTVYRALNMLGRRGLVQKVSSQNAYFATTPVRSPDTVSALVICRKCSQTRSVPVSSAILSSMLAPAEANVEQVIIEAYVECFGDERSSSCVQQQ